MSTEAKPRKPRKRAEGAPYTVAEAAERLHVSATTIYDAIRDKKLTAHAFGRGKKQPRYRIEERDLLSWWSSLRTGDSTVTTTSGAIRDHLAD